VSGDMKILWTLKNVLQFSLVIFYIWCWMKRKLYIVFFIFSVDVRLKFCARAKIRIMEGSFNVFISLKRNITNRRVRSCREYYWSIVGCSVGTLLKLNTILIIIMRRRKNSIIIMFMISIYMLIKNMNH
jgi:hypothetical protein